MADQVPLFPGNRGCGKRERGAAVTTLGETVIAAAVGAFERGERCVVIRIDGVKLVSPNRSRFTTRGGAMAEAAQIRKVRFTVRARVREALGIPVGALHLAGDVPRPSRVVITRLSFGELDRDNAWSSAKPAFDGIADAFDLPNDRELQKRGDVRQSKCKRGTCGVVLELFFSSA